MKWKFEVRNSPGTRLSGSQVIWLTDVSQLESQSRIVSHDVTQGSIPGPAPCNSYIDDLPSVLKVRSLKWCMDDSQLFMSSRLWHHPSTWKDYNTIKSAKSQAVTFDTCLTFNEHITKIVSKYLGNLCQISRVKHLLDKPHWCQYWTHVYLLCFSIPPPFGWTLQKGKLHVFR